MRQESATSRPRNIVVLGVDGLSYTFASEHLRTARTERLQSVFPTTSSAGWLSALTGLDVGAHLVPGVVFTVPAAPGELLNVFEYEGADLTPARETIFTDATREGYRPLAVLGDMETYGGAWRDALLRGAEPVLGHRFYTPDETAYRVRDPRLLVSLLRDAVTAALSPPVREPRLVWIYLELDRHVHEFGYDEHASTFLTGVEALARDLVQAGHVVLAHADHGLTPTRPDAELAELMRALEGRHGFRMGGAGRVRWLYPSPGTAGTLEADLRSRLPPHVGLVPARDLFPANVRERIGQLVLLAEGDAFLADSHYRWEHGSLTDAERDTPYATWGN